MTFREWAEDNLDGYTYGMKNYKSDIDCNETDITDLDMGIEVIEGGLWVSHTMITSLKGCARVIQGNFTFSYTRVTSLEGGPEIVGKNYNCPHNKFLTSLKGPLRELNGHFNCSHTSITSLKGLNVDKIKVLYMTDCDNVLSLLELRTLNVERVETNIPKEIQELLKIPSLRPVMDRTIDIDEAIQAIKDSNKSFHLPTDIMSLYMLNYYWGKEDFDKAVNELGNINEIEFNGKDSLITNLNIVFSKSDFNIDIMKWALSKNHFTNDEIIEAGSYVTDSKMNKKFSILKKLYTDD